MATTILFPLPNGVQPQSLVSRIEAVAQPGERVVFLMRYPVDGYRWCGDGGAGIARDRRLADYYRWDDSLQRAQHRVRAAIELLRAARIDASVQVYAGNLKEAVERNAGCHAPSVVVLGPDANGWSKAPLSLWVAPLIRAAKLAWAGLSGARRSRRSAGEIETA